MDVRAEWSYRCQGGRTPLRRGKKAPLPFKCPAGFDLPSTRPVFPQQTARVGWFHCDIWGNNNINRQCERLHSKFRNLAILFSVTFQLNPQGNQGIECKHAFNDMSKSRTTDLYNGKRGQFNPKMYIFSVKIINRQL